MNLPGFSGISSISGLKITPMMTSVPCTCGDCLEECNMLPECYNLRGRTRQQCLKKNRDCLRRCLIRSCARCHREGETRCEGKCIDKK